MAKIKHQSQVLCRAAMALLLSSGMLLNGCRSASTESDLEGGNSVGGGGTHVTRPLPEQDHRPIGKVVLDVTGETAVNLFLALQLPLDVKASKVVTGDLSLVCREAHLAGTRPGRGPIDCVAKSEKVIFTPVNRPAPNGGFLDLTGRNEVAKQVFDALQVSSSSRDGSAVKQVKFRHGRLACWKLKQMDDDSALEYRCQLSGNS